MPEFVLFSTYQDQIPNQVTLDELNKNEFIQDLSVVSDLDPQKIRRAAPVDQRRHKQDVNLRLNEDYEQFWS